MVQDILVRKCTWPFGCETAGIRLVIGFRPYSFDFGPS